LAREQEGPEKEKGREGYKKRHSWGKTHSALGLTSPGDSGGGQLVEGRRRLEAPFMEKRKKKKANNAGGLQISKIKWTGCWGGKNLRRRGFRGGKGFG